VSLSRSIILSAALLAIAPPRPSLVAKSRRLAQLHAHLAFAYWPRCRELGLLAV
jgi:hypothetical protein